MQLTRTSGVRTGQKARKTREAICDEEFWLYCALQYLDRHLRSGRTFALIAATSVKTVAIFDTTALIAARTAVTFTETGATCMLIAVTCGEIIATAIIATRGATAVTSATTVMISGTTEKIDTLIDAISTVTTSGGDSTE